MSASLVMMDSVLRVRSYGPQVSGIHTPGILTFMVSNSSRVPMDEFCDEPVDALGRSIASLDPYARVSLPVVRS